MDKKIIFGVVILSVGLLVIMAVVAGREQGVDFDINIDLESEEIIYFYGDTCPVCAEFDKYAQANNLESVVPFTKKEVYRDRKNNLELQKRAKICGILDVGVPFLWYKSECFLGYPDVVGFFESKMSEGGVVDVQESNEINL